jgi:hypothetical protein
MRKIMKGIGILLIVIGVIWGVVAFTMTTTVETGGETFGSGQYSIKVPKMKVHNLGLMEERRNHLMLSGFIILVGVLLFGFGTLAGTRTISPPTSLPGGAQLAHPGEADSNDLMVQSCISTLSSLGYKVTSPSTDKWAIASLTQDAIFYAYSAEDLRKITTRRVKEHQATQCDELLRRLERFWPNQGLEPTRWPARLMPGR